jgi:hypothetical protein
VRKLVFFNFYHNGDLYHSKPFVKEVINALGKENVQYAHYRDPMVIHDLGIESARVTGLDEKVKFVSLPDWVLINTWIGSYFDVFTGECTLNFNMKMWGIIYEQINVVYGTSLKLGPVEQYLPYIDYSAFDLQNTNAYLDTDDKKKVLFCNGPVHSGQCEYNGDMSEIIIPLAEQNPDITFITTKPILYKKYVPNIIDTSEIIKSDRCDLNEIGYLSKYCDVIVGRNSGPFCFASNRDNLNDPSKTFYAFGNNPTDCFTHDIPLKSNCIWEQYKSVDQLRESIRNYLTS